MTPRVMLLRGINVGGANRLRMADLEALLHDLGARDVASHIQSGNLVFSALPEPFDDTAFAQKVADTIARAHGFRPMVLVIEGADFREIVARYPFGEARDAPTCGHVWFLARAAEPDLAALAARASDSERFALTDRAFYLHAPAGIGRSKLAAAAERLLGVPATARNLGTCARLVAMLDTASARG